MLERALEGLRVIDFTQVAAGPTCTMMLANMGADVVKVESPSGDLGRALTPHVNGESVPFMALNRNKRSIVLDLKNTGDVAVARELIGPADVVVESFRPGVMDRLGVGYEWVERVNPRAIYVSFSSYGQGGAFRKAPGVDGVIQAVSGLMSITGDTRVGPCKVQAPIVDMVTGYLGAIQVLGAIQERSRTGRGQRVDVDMFSSAIALQLIPLASYMSDGIVPVPMGSAAPYAAPNEAFQCEDGWLMVAAYHPARWDALCRVLELPDVATDPRFRSLADRVANRPALVGALEARMRTRTRSHWLKAFADVDIICGPINDYEDLVTSPQFESSDVTEHLTHPVAGESRLPRARFGLDASTGSRPAAVLGQHTAELLQELAERKLNVAGMTSGLEKQVGT
ncbi:CoA transferase [Paraburkholderia sp. RL18-101-BIB-B]|uniref:CaiB/BaiF CoA transferase family protein n=1 Tax=Paraburkholderia sp. RL18-101-BIB-B TaxID=3031634 RepID=UPI0038BD4689